jgi:hypothetical protein
MNLLVEIYKGYYHSSHSWYRAMHAYKWPRIWAAINALRLTWWAWRGGYGR